MSDVMGGFERQYCELSSNLLRKCTIVATLSGEQKKQKLAELNNGLDEAESLIKKMDSQARGLQPAQKSTFLVKLKEYKNDLNNLKREIKKASAINNYAASRDELLEAGFADVTKVSMDQRERLIRSTQKLDESTSRIKDGRRVLLETEELGVSILQDLHQQRQALLHATDNLHGVDDNLGKSKNTMRSMTMQMDRNKWIIGGIIAFLVIIIVVIAIYKLKF